MKQLYLMISIVLRKFSIGEKQLLRYVLVGVCAVTIDVVIYTILSDNFGVSPSLSKRFGFICAAIWAFIGNKFFTFRQPIRKLFEPLLFVMVYTLGFFANSFMHDYILQITGIKLVAFIAATLTSTVLNFMGQRWIVFKIRS